MRSDLVSLEISRIQKLLKSGRFEQAFNRSVRAAKKWPTVAAFPRLSGIVAAKQNRHIVAKTHFERAWQLAPTRPEYIQNYGLSLLQIGDAESVIAVLERVEKSIDLPCMLLQLRALAQLRNRDNKAALISVESALKLDPDHVDSTLLLIDILQMLRRFDRAMQAARELAERNPDLAIAHLRMSKLLGGKGDFNTALQSIRRASDLSPSDGETLRYWSNLPNLSRSDKETLQLRISQLLARDSALDTNLSMAHFGAASLARSIGVLSEEMRHLRSAHGLLVKHLKDPIPRLQKLEKQRLAEPLFRTPTVQRKKEPLPIFVVGLPRSGTTLIEQIISAHSSVVGFGELFSVMRWSETIERGTDPDKRSESLMNYYYKQLPDVPRGVGKFVDKMPGNYAHLGHIAQAFPNSPIINVNRDPRDIVLSMWRQAFMAEGMAYAHDLNWLIDEVNRYQRYMHHWQELVPERIFEVSYEKLVGDIEGQGRSISDFCGLKYEETMLCPHLNSSSVHTASQNQVRREVYSSSIGGWQNAETWFHSVFDGLDQNLWDHYLSKNKNTHDNRV